MFRYKKLFRYQYIVTSIVKYSSYIDSIFVLETLPTNSFNNKLK